MPLTGNFKNDVSELMRECKAHGKFGNGRRSSFKACQRRALAAAYSAKRRKAKGGTMATRRKKRSHHKRGTKRD